MRVFVLLFNARSENEGIHTIQVGDRQKVLMFQNEDDATRFALMLEAQDFPSATVEAFDSQEIEAFCNNAGYDAELIEEGMLAVPPEHNVSETDWELEEKGAQTEPELDLEAIRRRLEGLL